MNTSNKRPTITRDRLLGASIEYVYDAYGVPRCSRYGCHHFDGTSCQVDVTRPIVIVAPEICEQKVMAMAIANEDLRNTKKQLTVVVHELEKAIVDVSVKYPTRTSCCRVVLYTEDSQCDCNSAE